MEAAAVMRKALVFFIVAAICLGAAFRYFRPDISWITDAASGEGGPIADMDQPLPHAVLPSVENDWVDMSKYKGQVVLIAFWTTWCPGCVDEVPRLIRLQQEYGARGFTVVGIAVDDQGEQSVSSFVKNKRFSVNGESMVINYPVLIGSDEVARKLGFAGGLPACVLVNREGREVKMIRGVVSETDLTKAVQRLVRN